MTIWYMKGNKLHSPHCDEENCPKNVTCRVV